MAAVARGSEAHFAELLRRYERLLAGFLRRQVGDADAEDVFQEVWLRVARGARRFDAARRFKPWLFGIALNESRSWLRKRPRRIEAGIEPGSVADPRGAPSGAAVDVERMLATLTQEQREVMVLRYQLDLSEEEIAQVLGIPRGTVKSRAHAALARLTELARSKAS